MYGIKLFGRNIPIKCTKIAAKPINRLTNFIDPKPALSGGFDNVVDKIPQNQSKSNHS